MEKLKRPEIIFAIFALVFGTIIMFSTIPGQVPDELPHYYRAQEVSQCKLYNGHLNQKTDYTYNSAAGYSPVMYIGPAIGLKIGNNYYFSGRFFNLLLWTILITIAIHITPIFKWAFFYTALLPTSIYLGMSYSADSFNNAFAFLFIAYLFKLIYKKEPLSIKKEFPILVIFTIIGALCKGLIFPIFLTLLIPFKKHKLKIFITLLFLSLFTAYLWSSNNYTAIRPDIYPEMNKYFLLHNPFDFFLLFLNTILISIKYWLISGTCSLTMYIFPIPIFILIMTMFFCNLYFVPEKIYIKPIHRLLAGIIIIFHIFFTSILMYFIYTQYGSNYIEGIQGRYFIPLIPLFFIIFGQQIHSNKTQYINLFKNLTIYTSFIILCYTCFVLKY